MSNNDIVYIYTDGACRGNPGPGGWGAILKYSNTEKEINGFSEMTTNNIMEKRVKFILLKIYISNLHVM